MSHDLGCSPHSDMTSSMIVFQIRIHPLNTAPLRKPGLPGRIKGYLISTPSIGINDRHERVLH